MKVGPGRRWKCVFIAKDRLLISSLVAKPFNSTCSLTHMLKSLCRNAFYQFFLFVLFLLLMSLLLWAERKKPFFCFHVHLHAFCPKSLIPLSVFLSASWFAVLGCSSYLLFSAAVWLMCTGSTLPVFFNASGGSVWSRRMAHDEASKQHLAVRISATR